jgi:hypothetical protein
VQVLGELFKGVGVKVNGVVDGIHKARFKATMIKEENMGYFCHLISSRTSPH